jgi:hypothetical protein
VHSIVLPCSSVIKTPSCLLDWLLNCLIAYGRPLRCRLSALVSRHQPRPPTPMASKRTVRPRCCAAIRPASPSAPGGSHGSKCIAERSMMRGRDERTPLGQSPRTVTTSTPGRTDRGSIHSAPGMIPGSLNHDSSIISGARYRATGCPGEARRRCAGQRLRPTVVLYGRWHDLERRRRWASRVLD